ncbi:MAG: MFS transporter, partial [Nocardioides sp.]|uniref:MFS transporter n=1 Tax=Nocardioides sp. TaxID=35761 RepID=UPI0039E63D28
ARRRAVSDRDAGRGADPAAGRTPPTDPIGWALLAAMLAGYLLVALQPTALMRDLTWGRLYIPVTGSGRWLTPLGLGTLAAAALFVLRCGFASRPLVPVRSWLRLAERVDLVGAFLTAIALGGVILAFATADPQVQVFSPQGRWYLVAAGIAVLALALHLRRASDPLVPAGAVRRTPAWGSILVSFFIGAALVAALIDIPLFARTTVYGDSQLEAALVLVRFLVALPIGALLGGYLTRRVPAGALTAAGMLLAAAGFVAMTRWQADTLTHPGATVPLLVGGLGFGVALAPVNAAVLASTEAAVHGLASSLVVVARMIGMLVGISVLTTLGLRRYYSEQDRMPSMEEVCGRHGGLCDAYQTLLKGAGIAQEHTVFAGAGAAALVGALLAMLLLRGAPTGPGPGRPRRRR